MTPIVQYIDSGSPAPPAEPGMFLFGDGFANSMSWGGQPGGIYRWMGGNEFIYTFPAPTGNNSMFVMCHGDDGTVYIGGNMSTNEGIGLNRVAKWDSATSNWVGLNGGLSGEIYGMDFIDGKLYVTGSGLSTASPAEGGQQPQIVYTAGVAVWNPATGLWEQLPWNTSVMEIPIICYGVKKFGSTFFFHGTFQPNDGSTGNFKPIALGIQGFSELTLPNVDNMNCAQLSLLDNDKILLLSSNFPSLAFSPVRTGTISTNFGVPTVTIDPIRTCSPQATGILGNGMGAFSETNNVNDWVGLKTGRYGLTVDASSQPNAWYTAYTTNGVGWSQRRYTRNSRGWYVDMGAGKKIYHPTFNTVSPYPWTMVSYDYNGLKTMSPSSYPTETREVSTDGTNGLRIGSYYFPDFSALDI